MTQRRKMLIFNSFPVLTGILFLLPLFITCERFPELVLEISTDSITNLANRRVNLDGAIKSFGKEPLDEHGFTWAATSMPTIESGDFTILGTKKTLGYFSSSISELPANTKFYVRSYATTSSGTTYGNELSFTSQAANLPLVSTTNISNILDNSAQSGGSITDDGGDSIIARGVCWGTSILPTLEDSLTMDGDGKGAFTSSITGLYCGTKYYLRAYATNKAGTGYGDTLSFTSGKCPDGLPSVTTSYLGNFTTNSALGGGELTDDGGSTISARGVCWSTSPSPTISDFISEDGTGMGAFTSNITGLTKSTTYYIRAYATNSLGPAYGEEVILRTYEGTVTDVDGYEYWTVVIGDQHWMAENLRTTHYANGSAIPLVESPEAWLGIATTDKAYSWYDNNEANSDIFGALYTWTAAINGAPGSDTEPSGVQGVCPNGWHLPSDLEWKNLELYLGIGVSELDLHSCRGDDEGGMLKEAGNSHWDSPNVGATNETGFTALPGGMQDVDGEFAELGTGARFWTASNADYSGGFAFNHVLLNGISEICHGGAWKDCGFSVRCIEGQGYSLPTVTTVIPYNISENTASSGGELTHNGGQEITEKGVCWSRNPQPTIDDFRSTDGSGALSFISSLTDLECGVTYYLRAYATNAIGTGYGNQEELTITQCPLFGVTVNTASITTIKSSSAAGGGNVTIEGDVTLTSRGICWSTSKNPTIDNSNTINGSDMGSFSSTLTGLNPETIYYVRAYAANSEGVVYGKQRSFITPYGGGTIPEAIIKKASSSPVIGGVIDEIWAEANVYNISLPYRSETPTLGSPGETTWQALWTEEGIWILISVTDDHFYPEYADDPVGNHWDYDKPEIYFDVNYDLADGNGSSQQRGHPSFSFGFKDGFTDGEVISDGAYAYAFLVDGTNYKGEYFFPFSILRDRYNNEIDRSGTIGFDITIIDMDPGDEHRSRAVWSNTGTWGSFSESWYNMDESGIIIFEDAE